MRAKIKGNGVVVIVVGGGERRESGRKKKMAIFFGRKIRATVSDRQIATWPGTALAAPKKSVKSTILRIKFALPAPHVPVLGIRRTFYVMFLAYRESRCAVQTSEYRSFFRFTNSIRG